MFGLNAGGRKQSQPAAASWLGLSPRAWVLGIAIHSVESARTVVVIRRRIVFTSCCPAVAALVRDATAGGGSVSAAVVPVAEAADVGVPVVNSPSGLPCH